VNKITCIYCNAIFTPEKEYDFGKYYAYWHECMPGKYSQTTVEKVRRWFYKKY